MSNFSEISHAPLRAYNRCVMAFNILEDNGRAPLEEYLKQFSYVERQAISKVVKMVKDLGHKRVKEIVTDGLTFTDDDYKEEQ